MDESVLFLALYLFHYYSLHKSRMGKQWSSGYWVNKNLPPAPVSMANCPGWWELYFSDFWRAKDPQIFAIGSFTPLPRFAIFILKTAIHTKLHYCSPTHLVHSHRIPEKWPKCLVMGRLVSFTVRQIVPSGCFLKYLDKSLFLVIWNRFPSNRLFQTSCNFQTIRKGSLL